MKKIYLLSILLALITTFTYAQNIVTYDFESKDPPKIPIAKLGENSVYKIININKFLYEVKIESSQSEFNSEPPAVFSNVFQMEKKEESSITQEAKQVIEQTDAELGEKESAFSLAMEKSSLGWNKLKLASFMEDLLEYKLLPDTLQDQSKLLELNDKIIAANFPTGNPLNTISYGVSSKLDNTDNVSNIAGDYLFMTMSEEGIMDDPSIKQWGIFTKNQVFEVDH